ncbi:MAG: fibronectin type III domain-containing protein [Verrucomicrobiota bacterium]|jgi:hypothetical protein
MRLLIVKLSVVAALLTGPLVARCGAQVTLVWNPSPNPSVAGYNLCWGTNSGAYVFTNTYPNTETNATLTDFLPNQAYYFAVAAFSSNGVVSPFSNETSFTNGPPSTNSLASTNGPPAPPGGGTPGLPGTNSPGQVNNGGGGGGNSSQGSSSNSAANFWGVPPFLTLTLSNGLPNLNIGGTVGATLMIQATTNIFSLDSWETVTNVALTNIAPIAQTNQSGQAQDALDLAFVPSAQSLPITPSNSTPFQFFRAVMPYDYVILASMVLPGKGYTPRLIVVNMPGIVCDDACYVNESSSFIHYSQTNSALQLEGSGSTIRQIATTLANSLTLDWTSASEFTYSNGLGQILATVVETEPSSSDPVAGQNPPSQPMVIDF